MELDTAVKLAVDRRFAAYGSALSLEEVGARVVAKLEPVGNRTHGSGDRKSWPSNPSGSINVQ